MSLDQNNNNNNTVAAQMPSRRPGPGGFLGRNGMPAALAPPSPLTTSKKKPGRRLPRERQRGRAGGARSPSPRLSRSHMNAKQGRKPMGPHSTSSAMSQLEKP